MDTPMSNREIADVYIENLPHLEVDQSFRFNCHPKVSCFNKCCADLDLVLHPFDILRLRQALKIGSLDFMARYTEVEAARGTGFPQVSMKMLEEQNGVCPFVSPQGCTVYDHRPGACRTYPLGRGASLDDDHQVVVQYVLVQEEHCQGFCEDISWKVNDWLSDQGLEVYNQFNDRHLVLMTNWLEKGNPLTRDQFGLVFMALYHLDELLIRIKNGNWLERQDLDEQRKNAILNEEPARLAFAFDWVESVLVG
jgi:Fe-S-cluster containining protein